MGGAPSFANQTVSTRQKNRMTHSTKLLLGGMAVGLTLAIASLVWQPKAPLPEGAMAMVGEHIIATSEFNATVSNIEAESKRQLTPSERNALLNRMIEEALLVQYANQQNLVSINPELRRRAVDLILQTLREQAAAMQPTNQQLAEFLTDNSQYFSRPPQELKVAIGFLQSSTEAQTAPVEADPLLQIATAEWQRRQAETLLDQLLANLHSNAVVQRVDAP